MSGPARARKAPFYRGESYWESEEPVVARTERVALSYFSKAGKLQVSILYPDKETGEKQRGKTVTLDMEDFQLHPKAGELLAKVLGAWR